MSEKWVAVFERMGGYDCMSDAWQIVDTLDDSVIAEVDLRHYDCPPGSGVDAAERRLVGESEALRNARLIAAAPELLEALESAAHELHLFCELHDRDEEAAVALSKAYKAIAKAKG